MAPAHSTPDNQPVGKGDAAGKKWGIQTLRKRADFRKAARGPRVATPGFILQSRKRRSAEADDVRVGFTCSKKVGNAVARNFAKRRLRAIARQVLPDHAQPGYDYVLIGRAQVTAKRPFVSLLNDLRGALQKLERGEK